MNSLINQLMFTHRQIVPPPPMAHYTPQDYHWNGILAVTSYPDPVRTFSAPVLLSSFASVSS